MCIRILFLSFLILFYKNTIAFPAFEKEENDSIRALYFKNIKTNFAFSVNYGWQKSSIFLIADQKPSEVLVYSRQSPIQMGLNPSILGINLPVSFSPSIFKGGTGSIQNLTISPSSFGRWIWWSAEFKYNRNFEMNRYDDFNSAIKNNNPVNYAARSDLKMYSIASSLTFVPGSNRLSSAAVYSFTAKQLRSAGSFLIGINSHFAFMKSDSSLVPNSRQSNFKGEQNFVKSQTISSGLSLGYTYTFVFAKNLFLNLTLLPSICTQLGYTTLSDNTKASHLKLVAPGDGFGYIAFGANGYRFYWGATLKTHAYRENPSGSNVLYSYTSPTITIGYRFLKWSSEQVPPVRKKDEPSTFEINDAVKWWADGYEHSGKVIERYKHEFYQVKEDSTHHKFIWKDYDLDKKNEQKK